MTSNGLTHLQCATARTFLTSIAVLELDVEGEGRQEPSAAKIRAAIESWLTGLNADEEIASRKAGEPRIDVRCG
jgi:hypothetical protein